MPEIVTMPSCEKKMFYLPAGDPYGKYVYLSEVLSTVRGRKLTEFIKFLLSFSQRRQVTFFYVVLLLIKSNWQINSKRFGNCKHTQSRKRIFKSNRPKISPGGMQNEKIENPQTLPEYRDG